MIYEILKELNFNVAKGDCSPYPMGMPRISHLDNASVSEQAG